MRYVVTDGQYLGARRGDVIEADAQAPRTIAALAAHRLQAVDEQAEAPAPQTAALSEPVAQAPKRRRAKR